MPYPLTPKSTDTVATIKATANYNAAFMNTIRLILLTHTEPDIKQVLSTIFT